MVKSSRKIPVGKDRITDLEWNVFKVSKISGITYRPYMCYLPMPHHRSYVRPPVRCVHTEDIEFISKIRPDTNSPTVFMIEK
jgi:hypothetical protein